MDIQENKLYKYNILISELKKKIFAGEFNPAGKLPTERQLAETFGYSRITIRSAMQQLKEEGIVEQTRRRGTFVSNKPYIPASKPVIKKLKIGCVCVQTDYPLEIDPYYSQIFLGFYKAQIRFPAFKHEIIPVKPSEKILDCLAERNHDLSTYDGYIFINYQPSDKEIMLMQNKGIKFVVMGEMKGMRRVPMVDMDNFEGTYMAARHLVDIGRKRPLLMYFNHEPWTERRLSGFRSALADSGILPEQAVAQAIKPKDSKGTIAALNGILRKGPPIDSIIVCEDWAALWAVDAIKKRKLRIPEDIAVIVYDTFPWILAGIKPKLTSITQSFARMAEVSAEMIVNLCSSPDSDVPIIIIKPELKIRESTLIK